MKIKFAMALSALALLSACGSDAAEPGQAAAETKAETAEEIVKALKASGLPVSNITVITMETDSNQLMGRPNQYTSKTDFYDARHAVDQNKLSDPVHTVEVFATAEDAKLRHDYVEKVTKGVPMLTQYLILQGNVLLRMDKAMLPDQAEEYRAAIKKIAS